MIIVKHAKVSAVANEGNPDLVQPIDWNADHAIEVTGPLAALDALVAAADKLAYFTGPDTLAVTDLTLFARTLLAAVNAGAARAVLSAQLAHANLTGLSSLTGDANELPYFTGAGNMAQAALSAFIRTLLDDADAATARGTLGAVNKAGDTLTGALTLSGDPTNALHAATKQYVDNVAAGLDVKPSVKAASTANVNVASAPASLDSIAGVAGDRWLLKNQTAPAENGIYVFAATGSALTRATDMDSWTEVPGALVLVEQGTTNADSGWVCSADQGGTLGTTALPWSQFFGTGLFQPSATNLTTLAALASVANLSALAGLTGAANKVAYFTGVGAMALLTVGTGASNLVQLDGSSKLPAVDGSQLTNLPSGIAAASAAQMEAASSTAVGSTPGLQQRHPGHPKAWVCFNGTGTVAIRDSYNVTSITDNGIADYTINFTTAFTAANYAMIGTCGQPVGGASALGVVGHQEDAPTYSTTANRIYTLRSSDAVAVDYAKVSVAYFGDQP